MSTEIIGLAGALSEWPSATAFSASLRRNRRPMEALLGERDSLKSLGISINKAEVDQRALTIAQQSKVEKPSQLKIKRWRRRR